MKRTILAAALLLGSTAIASAHDWGGYFASDIDARRANQMRRIEDGRRSGQLNWGEYRYLKGEQAQIAADERRAKADGYISLSEAQRSGCGLALAVPLELIERAHCRSLGGAAFGRSWDLREETWRRSVSAC